MTKALRIPILILMAVLSMAVFLFFIWTVLLKAYYFAFFAFTGVLVFMPLNLAHRRYWMTRLSFFVFGMILLMTTLPSTLGELNNRIKELALKPRLQTTLPTFSTREKLSIYGLNIMMGLTGYPFYPEVAKETFLMIFTPPQNGIREFQSDFSIHSDRIKTVIKAFNAQLKNKSGRKTQIHQRVAWHASDYNLGQKEARYALALNPSDVFLTATETDGDWRIEVLIRVNISYPQNSNVALLTTPKLSVEEGLFWVLQQEKWLFPYTAEWKFSVKGNDPRLE